MTTIVWSRGAFAILSTASVIALARSSFCCCVLPGYIRTLTMGMGIDCTIPVQESLPSYEILFSLNVRARDFRSSIWGSRGFLLVERRMLVVRLCRRRPLLCLHSLETRP